MHSTHELNISRYIFRIFFAPVIEYLDTSNRQSHVQMLRIFTEIYIGYYFYFVLNQKRYSKKKTIQRTIQCTSISVRYDVFRSDKNILREIRMYLFLVYIKLFVSKWICHCTHGMYFRNNIFI